MNSYMFKQNFLYDLPDELQSYIYDIKLSLDYREQLDNNFKRCIWGNGKFYNYICNEKFGYLFIDKVLSRVTFNFDTTDMIKKTFLIKYVNETRYNLINNENLQYLIDDVKRQFEYNVKVYHFDKENSSFTYKQLTTQYKLIRTLFDDKYMRIIIK